MTRINGVLVIGAVVLSACTSTYGSPAPTTPAPTIESAAPSPATTTLASPSAAGMLAPDTLAEVVTTDLVMRSQPGVTDTSVILDRVLQPEDRLFVLEGPQPATFYDWYRVQPFADSSEVAPIGWVAAASRDGEAWIAPATVDCPDPDEVDVFELDALHSLELLYCYGDRPLEVVVQAMGICSGYVSGPPNFTIEPTWLGMHSTCGWGREGQYLTAMQPYLEPSVGLQYPWGADYLDRFRLTGQFDHPESADCVVRELPGGDPEMPPVPDLTPEQVILGCRTHFAVLRAEEISEPASLRP